MRKRTRLAFFLPLALAGILTSIVPQSARTDVAGGGRFAHAPGGVTTSSSLLVGLSAYWKFEEASGNRADVFAASDFVPDGADNPGRVAGVQGFAIRLDRALTESVAVASNTAIQIGSGGYTVGMWVNYAAGSGFLAIMDAGTGLNGAWAVSQGIDVTTGAYFYQINTPFVQSTPATGALSLSVWHLVFVWYDPADGKVRLQVDNGTILSSPVLSGGPVTDSPDSLRLGSPTGAANFCDCSVDEMGVWHRVLDPGLRTAYYNNGLGVTHPFTGVYP